MEALAAVERGDFVTAYATSLKQLAQNIVQKEWAAVGTPTSKAFAISYHPDKPYVTGECKVADGNFTITAKNESNSEIESDIKNGFLYLFRDFGTVTVNKDKFRAEWKVGQVKDYFTQPVNAAVTRDFTVEFNHHESPRYVSTLDLNVVTIPKVVSDKTDPKDVRIFVRGEELVKREAPKRLFVKGVEVTEKLLPEQIDVLKRYVNGEMVDELEGRREAISAYIRKEVEDLRKNPPEEKVTLKRYVDGCLVEEVENGVLLRCCWPPQSDDEDDE